MTMLRTLRIAGLVVGCTAVLGCGGLANPLSPLSKSDVAQEQSATGDQTCPGMAQMMGMLQGGMMGTGMMGGGMMQGMMNGGMMGAGMMSGDCPMGGAGCGQNCEGMGAECDPENCPGMAQGGAGCPQNHATCPHAAG